MTGSKKQIHNLMNRSPELRKKIRRGRADSFGSSKAMIIAKRGLKIGTEIIVGNTKKTKNSANKGHTIGTEIIVGNIKRTKHSAKKGHTKGTEIIVGIIE